MTSYDELTPVDFDTKHITLTTTIGGIFGFAVVKSLVHLPEALKQLCLFDSLWAVKFYLATLGMSFLIQSSVCLANDKFYLSRCREAKGVLSVMLGSIMMGCGMAIIGSLPALAPIQIGTGIINAGYVILGGLLAVLVYGMLYKKVFEKLDSTSDPAGFLDDKMNTQYWVLALPLGVAFFWGLYFLEMFISTEVSPPMNLTKRSIWYEKYIPDPFAAEWMPYVGGAVVGLLQFPLVYFLNARMDVLFFYVAPVCTFVQKLGSALRLNIPSYFSHRSDRRLYWQSFIVIGSVGGASIAAFTSGMLYKEAHSISSFSGLSVGFLLVLGAAIAGGGFVGHFISGMSDLRISSILGFPFFCFGAALFNLYPRVVNYVQPHLENNINNAGFMLRESVYVTE